MQNFSIGGLFHRGSIQREPALESVFTSFVMALEEINNKTDGIADELLPNTSLLWTYRNTRCNEGYGYVASEQLTYAAFEGRGSDVLIGPYCSSVSTVAHALAAERRRSLVSFASTSTKLSGLPYFFRTVPADSHQSRALVDLITYLGFRRVATVASGDAYGAAINDFTQVASEHDTVHVLGSVTIRVDEDDLGKHMATLRRSGATVFVMVCTEKVSERVLNAARA